MPPVYDPNCNVRDISQRLVSPRINVSMQPNTYQVGTSPINVVTRASLTFVLIQNQANNPIYIGDATVSISNGYQLNPFSDITIPCDDSSSIFIVAGSTGNQVFVGCGL